MNDYATLLYYVAVGAWAKLLFITILGWRDEYLAADDKATIAYLRQQLLEVLLWPLFVFLWTTYFLIDEADIDALERKIQRWVDRL